MIQVFKTAFPHCAERFQPGIYLFHFLGIEVIKYFAACLLLPEQPAFGKNPDVFGYGLTAAVEMFRNGMGRHCLQSDKAQDSPSCGISDSLENISPHGMRC